MLQVVDEVLANPADRTKVSLVFGNVSEADILLKQAIDCMIYGMRSNRKTPPDTTLRRIGLPQQGRS